MIFGHSIDKQLQDGIRVTLIATGFDDNKEDKNESAFYSQSVKSQRKNSERTENRVEKNKEEEGDESEFDINDNKMLTEFYSTPAYKRCDVQLLSKENF